MPIPKRQERSCPPCPAQNGHSINMWLISLFIPVYLNPAKVFSPKRDATMFKNTISRARINKLHRKVSDVGFCFQSYGGAKK